jgi:DNA-binding SARP family transcriptional activator
MQALRDEQYVAIVRDLSGADLDDEWASAQRHGFGGVGASGASAGGTPTNQAPGHLTRLNGVRPASLGGPTGPASPTSPPRTAPAPRPTKPPMAPILPTPEPSAANRFRVPVDDLFRIDVLPATADPARVGVGIGVVPTPGAASTARHALNPANLPQFDLVVTPWHGDADTERILAVPHAAPTPTPAPPPPTTVTSLGLTTFASAGSLAPPSTDLGVSELTPELLRKPQQDATDRGAVGADSAASDDVDGLDSGQRPSERLGGRPGDRPGEWQTAYWNRSRAARSEQQNLDIDPAAMSRTIDILGPIDLSGTPATAGSRAADLAEVAAFVILHPGCSANQIAAELWPGRKGAVAIRDAQVARLREWLGTDSHGVDHLQVRPDGYTLGSSVSCDWLEFLRRVQAGELVSAISLVRGRPFEDAPLRRYGWAEGLRHEMTALVIDTAHYVAEACLREQNPRGAQNAAYRGLQAAPESELLYRDLLTALAEQGDLAAARQHADTLIAYADREGIDLQPETTDLLRDVLQAVPGA